MAETGGFGINGEASGEFVGADGSTHKIHYHIGGVVVAIRLPFTVSIDGVEVFKGAVKPTGLLWGIALITLVTAALLVWLS